MEIYNSPQEALSVNGYKEKIYVSYKCTISEENIDPISGLLLELWETILLKLSAPNDYFACYQVCKKFYFILKKYTSMLQTKLSTLTYGNLRAYRLPNGEIYDKVTITKGFKRLIFTTKDGLFDGAYVFTWNKGFLELNYSRGNIEGNCVYKFSHRMDILDKTYVSVKVTVRDGKLISFVEETVGFWEHYDYGFITNLSSDFIIANNKLIGYVTKITLPDGSIIDKGETLGDIFRFNSDVEKLFKLLSVIH